MRQRRELDPRKAGRIKRDLKVTKAIDQILNAIADEDQDLQEIAQGAMTLDIINKAQYNRFMNIYITNAMYSLNSLQKFNNFMFDKLARKKTVLSPSDYMKTFIRLKELENEHVKLLKELANTQQLTLDQVEREVVILFRSIPPELKQYLYETILGFVVQCPEIQKAIQETNQRLKEQQQSQENLE